MLTTTLRLLRQHGACQPRYDHLVVGLGQSWPDDREIPIDRILEICGLDDALWALCAVPPEQSGARDRLSRLLACDYADHVLPVYERAYPGDLRPREAIAVARRYAVGEATEDERRDAHGAAVDAAGAATIHAMDVGSAAWAAGVVYDTSPKICAACAACAARDASAAYDACYASPFVEAARLARHASDDADAEREWQADRLSQYLGEVS